MNEAVSVKHGAHRFVAPSPNLLDSCVQEIKDIKRGKCDNETVSEDLRANAVPEAQRQTAAALFENAYVLTQLREVLSPADDWRDTLTPLSSQGPQR